MNYRELERLGEAVTIRLYDRVYAGASKPGMNLDTLCETFSRRSSDFCGRSLSVGGMVVVRGSQVRRAWFVNHAGFAPVSDFWRSIMAICSTPPREIGFFYTQSENGCIGMVRKEIEASISRAIPAEEKNAVVSDSERFQAQREDES